MIAEFFAALPTVIKTYSRAASETPETYWLSFLAAGLSPVASTKYDLANIPFPLYSLGINAVIGTLTWRRKRSRGSTKRKPSHSVGGVCETRGEGLVRKTEGSPV